MNEFRKLERCDPLNPYAPPYQGVIEIPVPVGERMRKLPVPAGGRTRKMLAYVPEGARESTAGILILGGNGVTAESLLREGTWRNIADSEETKEKLIVFFLEPENGVWNTEEEYGEPDGDVAYVNAVALKAAERGYFCVHESKIYVVGYGEGGVIANMAVASNPAFYGGIVTAGGCGVQPEYLKKAGEDWCTYLHGYEDTSHRKNLRKGDIPVPAWIIHDPESEKRSGKTLIEHWKRACGVENQPWQTDPDRVEYRRTMETPYPLNQEKAAYRVCYSDIPGAAKDFRLARRIWKDFLYRQRRWMSCPGGDLRVTRDPVRDLGMEYHYETVDGWKREWYVHVPEAVRQTPEKKVPLVFALHGYTCDGEIYIGNSEWWKVADRYQFIVVFPSALQGQVDMPDEGLSGYAPLPAWNIFQEEDRPDELRFFRYVLDKTMEEHAIDASRVYATGHSWGSLMTQMLGIGMTDRLAAIAPCSGVFFGGASKKMTVLSDLRRLDSLQLPVWMHWGMEEGWLIPGEPSHENETGFTVEMWLKRNGKADMIPPDWSAVRPVQMDGRFGEYKFERDNTAPVWFTQVEYMPHATMPEMSFRIWEQFFRRFSRDADGRTVTESEA